MKSLSKKVISTFLSIFISGTIFAQNNDETKDNFLSEFVSRNWTAADGLPGNSITSVMQDTNGYIYIGTYDGLVRFDGVEFVTFNKNAAPKYNFVSARTLFQDSKGNIYVGSNDEGIVCIQKDGTTKNYTTKNGLPNNSIRAICEDNFGNVWIGTASGLIYIKDWEIVTPKGLDAFGEENVLVTNLFCDSAGRVWISTSKENELFVYTNKKFGLYKGITKIKNPSVNYVMQDNAGAFWFGVAPHYAVKINGNKEEVFDVGHGVQKGTVVNSIYQDRNANLWFALDTGVTVFHEGKFSYFNHFNGLADDKVTRIIEDREGNMWFTTDRAGIQKLSLSKFKTTTMQTTVNAICDDVQRGVTWLAGDNGLYCLKNNEFIENEITELCKNIRIRHVELSNKNELLISTYEKLGQILVEPNGKIHKWTKKEGLTGNKTRVAIKTKDDDLFIGTTSGLNIIDKNGKITAFTKDNNIPNEFIMCIFEDLNGKLWCGTDGGGIFTLVKENDSYKVEKKYTTNEGLAGNVIFKIAEIGGNIWVCTGTGISRISNSKGTEKIFNFNSSNGLGSDGVFQILLDYTGTAWMTSNRGIFNARLEDMDNCADGKTKHITTRYFGKSDGLVSGGATSTALSTKDSFGRIWFTLIDGFAIFDPVKITAIKTAPLVQIQEISIDNEKMPWNGETIKLPPSTKRFGIKFTGISFVSSEQMKFSTKLEGFDSDYSEWSTTRNVSFTNLKHGNYKFSVIAQNGDDVRSHPSDSLFIIKEPYIWELVWFWLLIGLILIGTAALIIYIRFRSMKIRQIELEEKVEERTQELKQEKERSEELLLNILPKEIAEELSLDQNKTISKSYPKVTVMFTDIVGFTKMSDSLSANTVVKMLNDLFTKFDERAKAEGIEKIKTIGDSYMAAAGLTENENNEGAQKMIRYAKGILRDLERFNETSDIQITLRVGLNTGNLVAGVIGKTKFIYDIWGDTVNTASRMESSGIPLKIHVSESTYKETKGQFKYSAPVEVEVKGKGLMSTFYVE